MNAANVAFSASESETTEFVCADSLHRQNELQNEQEAQDLGLIPLSDKPIHPASGSIGADEGTVTNRILISNSSYFTTPPRHGVNSTNTCGPVAVQLMLSYHNYYSDRRIIAPQHLHGGWNTGGNGNTFDIANYTNSEQTSNACADLLDNAFGR